MNYEQIERDIKTTKRAWASLFALPVMANTVGYFAACALWGPHLGADLCGLAANFFTLMSQNNRFHSAATRLIDGSLDRIEDPFEAQSQDLRLRSRLDKFCSTMEAVTMSSVICIPPLLKPVAIAIKNLVNPAAPHSSVAFNWFNMAPVTVILVGSGLFSLWKTKSFMDAAKSFTEPFTQPNQESDDKNTDLMKRPHSKKSGDPTQKMDIC